MSKKLKSSSSNKQDGKPAEYTGRCVIVHPELAQKQDIEPSIDDKLEEACGLARAINLEVLDTKVINLKKIAPGYLLGKGHREELTYVIKSLKPDIVIINHMLTPVQQRNLEKQFHAKVIDRTGLILEIFGARAQTSEGKIQVELAALEYQRSRLVRSWTHLERQRGSTSFVGGPGETQIEIDRRLIGERIARLKKDLKQVRKNRELQRRSREQVPFPIVALVGYTNAGKSTLFNLSTGASVYAEDLPFATLDPTMRKKTLSSGQDIIFADTVGFISDLPTHLVAAFRATLEQLEYADIIIHVRDISRHDHKSQKQDVIDILEDLNIFYEKDDRIIEVWNKIDLLPLEEQLSTIRKAKGSENTVAISALTGEGTDILLEHIDRFLALKRLRQSFELPITEGKALAWLYEYANILSKSEQGEIVRVDVEIDPADSGRFTERFGYKPAELNYDDEKKIYGSEY